MNGLNKLSKLISSLKKSKVFPNVIDIIKTNHQLRDYICQELEKKYQPYQNQIKIHIETILSGDSSSEGLQSFFESKRIIKQIVDKINISITENYKEGKNDYYAERYCNIAKVMRDFARNTELQSLLYLGMASAKDDKVSTLQKDVLNFIVEKVNKDAGLSGTGAIHLFYLTSAFALTPLPYGIIHKKLNFIKLKSF